MKKWLKTALIVAGSVVMLLSALPFVVYGMINIGVWLPFVGGAFLVAYPFIRPLFQKLFGRSYKWVSRCFWMFIAAGCLFEAGLLCYAARRSELPMNPSPDVIIVMGCRVNGTQPSTMLTRRLQTALELLESHPDIPCVVSGGLGSYATVTEAEAMKNWLVRHGIPADRIICENMASDTDTSMQYCARIISDMGLGTQVVTVTDAFHQARTALYAARSGLTATPCNTAPDFILHSSYWIRDTFGIVEYMVFA